MDVKMRVSFIKAEGIKCIAKKFFNRLQKKIKKIQRQTNLPQAQMVGKVESSSPAVPKDLLN